MNKKIKLIGSIVGILLFVLLIAGVSYAWITWRSSNTLVSGSTECMPEATVTGGGAIENANVLLFDESKIVQDNMITIKNGMALTHVEASAVDDCDVYDMNFGIKIDTTNINDAFISGDSVGAFKYAVASYDIDTYTDISVESLNGISFEILKYGSIVSSGETYLIDGIPLSSTVQGFLIIFYVDGYLVGNGAANSTFSATLSGVAMPVEPEFVTPLSDFVYALGSEQSSVELNKVFEDEISSDSAGHYYSNTPDAVTLEADEVLLLDYIGTSKNVNVPSQYTVDGITYTVKLLSSYAVDTWIDEEMSMIFMHYYYGVFIDNDIIEYVVLDDALELIVFHTIVDSWDNSDVIAGVEQNSAKNLFNGCSNLTNVSSIPSLVTNLDFTFEYSGLVTAPVIPNSVTSMDYTFSGSHLVGDVEIEASNVVDAEYIFGGIFFGCTADDYIANPLELTVYVPKDSTTYSTIFNEIQNRELGCHINIVEK